MKTANRLQSKAMLLALGVIAFILFTAALAKADTNVSVDIQTDEDVYFDTNINTTGSVDVTIDGAHLNDQIANALSGNNADLISWQNLMYIFNEVSNYFYRTGTPHPVAVNLFNSLNSVFVNRADEQAINSKLDNLNMRVLMLERTMEKTNAEAYCEGKISVMKEYNLTWVKCGISSTYYYNVDPKQFGGNDIIAIDVSEPNETAVVVKAAETTTPAETSTPSTETKATETTEAEDETVMLPAISESMTGLSVFSTAVAASVSAAGSQIANYVTYLSNEITTNAAYMTLTYLAATAVFLALFRIALNHTKEIKSFSNTLWVKGRKFLA